MQVVNTTDIIFSKLNEKLSKSSLLLHKKSLKLITLIKEQIGNEALGENGAKFYLKKIFELFNTLISKIQVAPTEDDIHNSEALIFLLAAVLKNSNIKTIRKSTQFALDISSYFLKRLSSHSKKYIIIIIEKLLSTRTEIELKDSNDLVIQFFNNHIVKMIEDKDDVIQKQLIKTFSRLLKIVGFIEYSKMTVLLNFENYIKVKLHGLNDDSEKLIGQDVYTITSKEGNIVIKFLSSVLQFLPFDMTNNLIIEILNVLESNDPNVVRYALLCMELAISSKPFDITTLEKIMTSLLDLNLMLGEEDNEEVEKQLITFYVKSITQCLNAIGKKNLLQGLNHTTSVISILGEYLSNENGEIQSVIFNSLNSIISFTLSTSHLDFIKKHYFETNSTDKTDKDIEDELIGSLSLVGTGDKSTAILGLIEKICTSVLYLLGDRFENTLKLSFSVIYNYMERIYKYEFLQYINEKILTIVSENSNIRKTSHFKSFLGKCFNILDTKLIFNFFPIQCLDYDIQSEDYTENSNIWILSYMDKYLREEKTLKEFLLSFIVIIEDIEKIIEKLHKSEKIETKKEGAVNNAKKNMMDVEGDIGDMENENYDDNDKMDEDDFIDENDELNENFMVNSSENKYLIKMKIKRYELIIQQIWRLCPYFCGYNTNTSQDENDDFSTFVHYFLEKIDATLSNYTQTRVFIFKSLSKIISNAKLKNDIKALKVIKKEGKKFFIRTINWLIAVNLSNEEMKEGFLLFSNFSKVLPEKELYAIICKEIETLNEKIPKPTGTNNTTTLNDIEKAKETNTDNNKDNKAKEKKSNKEKDILFIENKTAYGKSKKVLLLRLSLINYLIKSVNLNDTMSELIQTFFQANFFNLILPNYLKKNMFDLFLIMLNKETNNLKILNIFDLFIQAHGLTLIPSAKQKSKLYEFMFNKILEVINQTNNKADKMNLLNVKYSNLILEIIILTKDLNRKVRNNAYEVIANITDKLWEENLFEEWIYHLLSKLSSDNPFVVSSGINSLARAFWQKKDETNITNLLIQTYTLINDKLNEKTDKFFNKNKEVIKSIFLFLRVFLFLINDINSLTKYIPSILNNVFDNFVPDIRLEFKVKIRNLIKNLLIKLGYEEMKKVFPVKHESLLNYINKHIVKKIKKFNHQDELIYGSDKLDDSVMLDNDENLLVDEEEDYIDKEFKKLENKRKSDEEKFLENVEKFNIDENEEDELDKKKEDLSKEDEKKLERSKKLKDSIQNMLSKNDVELKNHFYVNPYVQEKMKAKENLNTDEEKDNNDVYYDKKKGKLIIKNAEEKTFIQKKRIKSDDPKGDNNDSDNENEIGKVNKKRKVQEKDGNTFSMPAITSSAVAAKDKKVMQGHTIKFSGKEYSGKGGRGDLLLKNKPEPFAYIQLNPKANSKKRRGESVKVFEQVMRPKNRGSSIGGLKIKTRK